MIVEGGIDFLFPLYVSSGIPSSSVTSLSMASHIEADSLWSSSTRAHEVCLHPWQVKSDWSSKKSFHRSLCTIRTLGIYCVSVNQSFHWSLALESIMTPFTPFWNFPQTTELDWNLEIQLSVRYCPSNLSFSTIKIVYLSMVKRHNDPT
jgi:hypothetical protein